MAKQQGIYKTSGVVDDLAYYFSRNGGWLKRKINPNFGEWVKTRDEFANTRKNAAEFSAAGQTASALVRGITQRWRFITTPKLTGDATTVCIAGQRLNSSGTWGERSFNPAYFSMLQDCVNRNIKKAVPGELQQWLRSKVLWNATEDKLHVTQALVLSAEMEQHFMSMGATGVRIELWLYRVTPSIWEPVSRQWLPAASQMSDTAWAAGEHSITGRGGASIIIEQENATQFVPQNTQNYAGGVLMFIAPYKTVAGVNITLQSACTAYWYSVADEGDAPTPGQTLTIRGNVYPSGAGSITGLGTYQAGEVTNIAFLDENGDPFTGWITTSAVVNGHSETALLPATEFENLRVSDIISIGMTDVTINMYNGVVPIVDHTAQSGDSPGGGWGAPAYATVGENAYFDIFNLPEGSGTPWLLYRQYALDGTLLDIGKVQTIGISVPVQGAIVYAWCAHEPVLEPEEWEIDKPDDIDVEYFLSPTPEIGQEIQLQFKYNGSSIKVNWRRDVDGTVISSTANEVMQFTVGKYNEITIEKIGTEPVTLTTGASPQAAAHVVGGGDYQPGVVVTLQAVRDDASYTLDHWEKDGVSLQRSDYFLNVWATEDATYVAVFVQG